jgi:hypothetical protein
MRQWIRLRIEKLRRALAARTAGENKNISEEQE